MAAGEHDVPRAADELRVLVEEDEVRRVAVPRIGTLEPKIEGRQWLELRGQMTEPIRDVQDVVFKLWSDPDKRVGPARPNHGVTDPADVDL